MTAFKVDDEISRRLPHGAPLADQTCSAACAARKMSTSASSRLAREVSKRVEYCADRADRVSSKSAFDIFGPQLPARHRSQRKKHARRLDEDDRHHEAHRRKPLANLMTSRMTPSTRAAIMRWSAAPRSAAPRPSPGPGGANAHQNDPDHGDDRAGHDGRKKLQHAAAPLWMQSAGHGCSHYGFAC